MQTAENELAKLKGDGRGGGGGSGLFQRELQLHFAAGVNQITGTFTVPATAHLVIETVTADILVAVGEQPFLFVTTVANGVSSQHSITLAELPRSPNGFAATHCVRLYADPGSTVTVMLTRWGSSPYPQLPKPELVTISGMLTS